MQQSLLLLFLIKDRFRLLHLDLLGVNQPSCPLFKERYPHTYFEPILFLIPISKNG